MAVQEGERRMIITMVIDLYGDKNNGTTVTAMRTCESLLSLGHEVRVIAYVPDSVKGDVINGVKVLRCEKAVVPVFEGIIESQGFTFGKTSEKKIAEFIKGSDVVHLMFPFPLEVMVYHVAKLMHIPVTGAYHLQPENITYTAHLGKCRPVNCFVYALFRNWLYRYLRTIHTPSQTMRQEMIDHHYRGDIHAISNGVVSFMHPIEVEKPKEYQGRFVITMVGRLSGEKRQELIIKAIGKSRYNDKIQLILCGIGPKKERYQRLADKYLKNPVNICFVDQDKLREILNYSDLYVHSSDVESEAIACIEAFSCGLVPVISDSPYTATRHFSLDEHCLFKAGDYHSLMEKIAFFIENPEYKKDLSSRYVEYAKEFEVISKAKELVSMMELEIERSNEDDKKGRTYYSSRSERRKLRSLARKIGIKNPLIYDKDIYHSSEKKEFINKKD